MLYEVITRLAGRAAGADEKTLVGRMQGEIESALCLGAVTGGGAEAGVGTVTTVDRDQKKAPTPGVIVGIRLCLQKVLVLLV